MSRYEAIERLLTRSAAAGDPDRLLPTWKYADASQSGSRLLSGVVRWPLRVGGPATDGTGIAVHRDRRSAVLHAVFELLERTLLARLWYGGGIPFDGSAVEMVPEGIRLEVWCQIGHDVSFAVAEAHDNHLETLTLGAAVRSTATDAVEHARAEAIMLLGSVRERAVPSHIQAEARERAAGLRGPLAAIRSAYLRSKIREAQSEVATRGTSDLFALAGVKPGDVDIAEIFSGPDWIFLRAIDDGALLIKDARRVTSPSSIVPDPFC
ncbi:YcaO-like family protein [Frankia sp. Cr2]|uniref:YcaO-like family protein n=1 Tax=Frankia sp. Cr2 TaxID=3073932 RepID=UPI003A1013A0